MWNAYRIQVAKPEVNTNECHKHKWEHVTTKMELKLYDVKGVDWIHPAQDTGQRRGSYQEGNELVGSMKQGKLMTLNGC